MPGVRRANIPCQTEKRGIACGADDRDMAIENPPEGTWHTLCLQSPNTKGVRFKPQTLSSLVPKVQNHYSPCVYRTLATRKEQWGTFGPLPADILNCVHPFGEGGGRPALICY